MNRGDVDGVVIRVDDVTERQHMIGELETARSRAEQSDKLKSAFLANMSHEIRTPLNAIVGFSDLLMVTEDQEEKEEFIQIINANNELLLKLINDILDLSKIESGTLKFVWSDVNINAMIYDLEKVFQLRNKNNPEVEIRFVPGMEECVIRTERLMGGRIGVEFEQGEGSTFWFTIPQKPIIHFAERREIVRAMENY